MSYTPTEWKCGDTITAEKLNKLENGLAECCGGGGTSEPLIVRAVDISRNGATVTITTDTTWQEVYDALGDGRPCYLGTRIPDDTCADLPTVEELGHVMFPIMSAYRTLWYMIQDLNDYGFYTIAPNEPLIWQGNCGL